MQRVGWRLLPFLVITSTQLHLASCVARSSIISQHPLTLNWAEGDDRTASLQKVQAQRNKLFYQINEGWMVLVVMIM